MDLPSSAFDIVAWNGKLYVGTAPELAASRPVLGAQLTIDVRVAKSSNIAGVLMLGGVPSRPLDVGRECVLYPDFAAGARFVGFAPDASGRWSRRVQLPNRPTLLGARVMAQVGIGPTAQPPLGADFSRGLLLNAGR